MLNLCHYQLVFNLAERAIYDDDEVRLTFALRSVSEN